MFRLFEEEDKMPYDHKYSDGQTPLHKAGYRGNEGVLKRRLEEGVDSNARDNLNRTPLHVTGNSECIELLLEYKANINAKDSKGDTPLHCAGNLGTVETLLKHNAKILTNNEGLTPLDRIKELKVYKWRPAEHIEKMITLVREHLKKQEEREGQQKAFIFGFLNQPASTPKTPVKVFRDNELFDKNVVKELFKFM